MTTLNKILIGAALLLLSSLLIFSVYKNFENSRKLNEIQTSLVEQKQLVDNITRSSGELVSKEDFDKLLKSQELNLKAIQKDIDSLNGKITGIQTVSVVSNAQTTTDVPSTTTVPSNSSIDSSIPDPYGYLKNTQHLTLNEKFGEVNVPIGDVAFSASKEKPWSFALPQRTYRTTTVLSTDTTGKQIAYTKFSIDSDGKTFDVKIQDNKVVTVYPSAKMSWFNPHLQFQANGGVQMQDGTIKGEFLPSISLMLSSYGKTKGQPDLQFAGVGVGYGVNAKKPNFIFTPIQANISKLLPFTSNMYVGPYINVNTSGNIGAGLGISINF